MTWGGLPTGLREECAEAMIGFGGLAFFGQKAIGLRMEQRQ
jgi:hypothetical protein